MNRVCVFCGSNAGSDPLFAETARKLGHLLADRSIGLVFGGGKVGLMGILADSVLERKGEVIGVIPKPLARREIAHEGVPDLRIVRSMHERKALMAKLADAFVTLPGGLGTLEECCEILTWALLGIHRKPIGVLDVNGYYDPFLTLLDRQVEHGFLRPEHRELVVVRSDPALLLDALAEHEPQRIEPLLEWDQT
jgi:hypothetical protein